MPPPSYIQTPSLVTCVLLCIICALKIHVRTIQNNGIYSNISWTLGKSFPIRPTELCHLRWRKYRHFLIQLGSTDTNLAITLNCYLISAIPTLATSTILTSIPHHQTLHSGNQQPPMPLTPGTPLQAREHSPQHLLAQGITPVCHPALNWTLTGYLRAV